MSFPVSTELPREVTYNSSLRKTVVGLLLAIGFALLQTHPVAAVCMYAAVGMRIMWELAPYDSRATDFRQRQGVQRLVVIYALFVGVGIALTLLPGGAVYANFTAFLIVSGDTGAQVAGKSFKGVKLAPGISPGKTLSGTVGGVLLAWVFGVVALWVAHPLLRALPLWAGVWLVVMTPLIGLAGDLFESSVKRAFGVKDFGYILREHGSFADRSDAFAPALIHAAAVYAAACLISWLCATSVL